MRVARGLDQLDERAQKSPCFAGVVGCATLFQQPVKSSYVVLNRVFGGRAELGIDVHWNRNDLRLSQDMQRDVAICTATATAVMVPVVGTLRAKDLARLREIAAELSDCGILTRRGGRWHVSTVKNPQVAARFNFRPDELAPAEAAEVEQMIDGYGATLELDIRKR